MKTVSDNADAQVLGFGNNIPDGLQFPFAIDMREYDKVCFLVSLSEAGIPPNRVKVQLFESTGLGQPETLVKETAEIDVDGSNVYYADVDGILYNKAKTILIQCPGGKSGAITSIPNSVTTIGDYSFQKSLEQIYESLRLIPPIDRPPKRMVVSEIGENFPVTSEFRGQRRENADNIGGNFSKKRFKLDWGESMEFFFTSEGMDL